MADTQLRAGQAVAAAAIYAATVFAFAFVTGVARTLLVAADIGVPPAAAVLVEVPLILLVAWLACGLTLVSLRVKGLLPTRLVMSAASLLFMLAAEYAAALLLARQGLAEFMASYARLDVQIGLAGQIAFAALPLVRLRRL